MHGTTRRRGTSLVLLVVCTTHVLTAISLTAQYFGQDPVRRQEHTDAPNEVVTIGPSVQQHKNLSLETINADVPRSVLMVVAHADDDVIWGGEFLLREGRNAHVVVVCTRNRQERRTSERLQEFESVQRRLGFQGEFLDGKDSPHSKTLERHVRRRIQKLACSHEWDKIITHGPEGEYGHPQHHLIHDTVVHATRKCCHAAEKIHVFEPHPVANHAFSKAKRSVAKLYKSQEDVVQTFSQWKEQIVPLADYNYTAASQTCLDQGEPTLHRQCRLHKREYLGSNQTIGCHGQKATNNVIRDNKATVKQSPDSTRLEALCTSDQAPIFVTFAIAKGKRGRWSIQDAARAIRIMYSSLVKSHGCAVQLFVHSNVDPKQLVLHGKRGYTTMGTSMTGLVFRKFNKAYMKNPYNDKVMFPKTSKWFALSRAKLDTLEEYLENSPGFSRFQHPVWIDLDTIVLDKVAVNAPVPWVYGYQHQTAHPPRRIKCFGDLFSLDRETIQTIRDLEYELLERIHSENNTNLTLPMYDLQGYFEILLDRHQKDSNSKQTNTNRLHIVQEEHPAYSFGFDCSLGHPFPETLKDRLNPWKGDNGLAGKRLLCPNYRGEPAMVASMSFTAPSFQQFFLKSDGDTRFEIISNVEARNMLNNFFYNLS